MLTATQIRDAQGTVHDLGELVSTQCTITVLSTLPTPQPGIYMTASKCFHPTAQKRWAYEEFIESGITYSSKELAHILSARSNNVIISER
jgi:hypothetical protein